MLEVEMDISSLGKRIKTARRERGLTGEKLAELCNINATYLRQIEGGTKTPSLPMFVVICRQLRVSPDYLLSDSVINENSNAVDRITELMKKASPSQADMIIRMLESALSVVDNNK